MLEKYSVKIITIRNTEWYVARLSVYAKHSVVMSDNALVEREIVFFIISAERCQRQFGCAEDSLGATP
jgi:hypothetical protein